METTTPPVVPPANPVPTAPTTSQLAIWSLVLSLLGFVCLCCVGFIPGVITGHMARSRIRASGGTLGGDGLALAGLIIGYLGNALLVAAFVVGLLGGAGLIPGFDKIRSQATQQQDLNNLRQIGMAIAMYEMEHTNMPPPDLSSLKDYMGDADGSTRLFICPGTGAEPGDWEDVDFWSDYQYVTNAASDTPAEAVRAFCKQGNHEGEGGAVLYQDSHVEWLEEDLFRETIEPYLE